MIFKIESKIDAHIKSILKKDAIDFSDYQILVSHLAKLKADEQTAKWEEDKEARSEMWQNVFKLINK